MEVTARVTSTATLDGVHANCDCALVCGVHMVRRVGESTLLFGPLASPSLKLAAHLQTRIHGRHGRRDSQAVEGHRHKCAGHSRLIAIAPVNKLTGKLQLVLKCVLCGVRLQD